MSTLAERFWLKVDASGDCWEWTSGVFKNGYGRIRTGGTAERRSLLAHRVAWELLVGPIADGLQLDHRCRNRRCVNPDHLEPVTGKVNLLRGQSLSAINARKTHCKNGHPLTPSNVYVGQTSRGTATRVCRICRLAWMAARYAPRGVA